VDWRHRPHNTMIPEVNEDREIHQWLAKILILVPGFISLGLARYLGECRDLSDLELVIYSLALSLVIIFVTAVLYRGAAALQSFYSGKQPVRHSLPPLNLGVICLALVLACGSGLVLAKLWDSNIGMLVARRALDLTKRDSGRTLPFLLDLDTRFGLAEADSRPPEYREQQAYLEVVLTSGRHLAGKPVFFGNDNTRSEIFLSRACTIDGSQTKLLQGPGIAIPEDRIDFVLFVDRDRSDCNQLWKTWINEHKKAGATQRAMPPRHATAAATPNAPKEPPVTQATPPAPP
jgi:hypothetical protein